MTQTSFSSIARAGSLAALFLLGGCGGGEDGPDRPHIVLITLDTVRADHLTCYGGKTGDTPALDAIAAAGTLFEEAVSVSGLTPTSHATILTGRFQYEHGLRVLAAAGGYRLDDDVPTLATVLKAEGYRTAAVHSAFPVSSTFGFNAGFDHFDSLEGELEAKQKGKDSGVGWDVSTLQRRSDETTARALKWMEGALQDGDGPIFLWLHYWDPHDQRLIPPKAEFERLFYDEVETELRDQTSRAYAAEVRWQDQSLGQLFQGLNRLGALDSALLAVTADHGQGLGDGLRIHGWGAHRMLYREQVHVPLLLRGPGVPAGTRVPTQVRTADIAPTLLELAGLDAEASLGKYIAGESLAPLLVPGAAMADRVAYGEQISGYDDNAGMRKQRPDAAFLHMVSDGEWKLIYRPHMPNDAELFHVTVDPMERRNVVADHPDVYLRLMADLAARNPWVLQPFQGPGAHGAAEGLGGLGYTAVAQGSGTWWWTCPEHMDVREEARGIHEECGRILVPAGNWAEPE